MVVQALGLGDRAELSEYQRMIRDRDELLKRIGGRIRQRRLEFGFTQAELAGDRLTKSFISQIEKGTVAPSIETLELLAERLDRPVEWFVAENPAVLSPLHEAARAAGIEPMQARAFLVELLRRM